MRLNIKSFKTKHTLSQLDFQRGFHESIRITFMLSATDQSLPVVFHSDRLSIELMDRCLAISGRLGERGPQILGNWFAIHIPGQFGTWTTIPSNAPCCQWFSVVKLTVAIVHVTGNFNYWRLWGNS